LDDTSNWETAAAIAAICIGLMGLLVFSLVAAVAVWRMAGEAQAARRQGDEAEEAARELRERVARLEREAADLMNAGRQADALLGQQEILREAVRSLVESGVLRGRADPVADGRLEATIRRLDEAMIRLTITVEQLGRRSPER
jgi:hypothetical protein